MVAYYRWSHCQVLLHELKDPSQPLPFSWPSKLVIHVYHGEVNSYCFTVSCVPQGISNNLE